MMTKEQAKRLAARIRSEVSIWTDECKGDSTSYNTAFGVIHQSANVVNDIMCVLDPANETLGELLRWLEREEVTLREWWNAVQDNDYKADYQTYKAEKEGKQA